MEQAKTTIVSPEATAHTVRKVVEITDTPIKTDTGRMTPGFVDLSEIWANEKRAPGYQMEITL